MPLRRTLALITAALLLTGCAANTPAASETTTAAPAPTSTPSQTPTPQQAARLVVSIDGLEYVTDGVTDSAPFTDSDAVLALLSKATGVTPEGEQLDTPDGYDAYFVKYQWDGISAIVDPQGGYASVAVTSAATGDVELTTAEGVSVGAPRDAVTAAGGWEVGDMDGDGVTDSFGLGSQEVPGTTSLTHPGEVGIEYVLLQMNGDTVGQIQSPGNDYSDI
ncbi:hypothetical protein AAIB33_08670 [Microbacterium sp. AZCO]|uniref:hypothetical protein n=1 Tax=Microbacterium sp. AZCO TaxID=3142976 RepID=UPI0031F3DE05